MVSAMPSWVFMATKASRPKRSSTPASMPEASDTGIRLMVFSNTPEKPQAAISAAEIMKAPMASDSGRPAALLISMAAPGVDHAVTTGMR